MTPRATPRPSRRITVAPGDMIGGYSIVDELGGGGMGVVYVGEHHLLGRRAAIKVLRPEHSHVPDVVQRFFAEARATTAIRHPGIVEVYDFGDTGDGLAYLVMELLEGVSLARRLERGQRIPVPVALVLIRRIVLALSAAHERGIVHRDVKPDNIFLVRDADGGPVAQIKLLDFGIARLLEDSALAARKTCTGVVMGTPLYMSPEQCRGASDCDHRTDLYSLGCVFFEMLAGQPPFVADSASEMLVAHLHTPAPDVRTLAPEVPRDVAALIDRLLAKDPGQRFDSARALVATLDPVIERHAVERRSSAMATVAATPSRTTSPRVERTVDSMPPARSGAVRLAAAAGALLLVAVAAIGLVTFGRGGASVPPSVDAAAAVVAPAAAPPPPPPPVDAGVATVDAGVAPVDAPAPPIPPPRPPPRPPRPPDPVGASTIDVNTMVK